MGDYTTVLAWLLIIAVIAILALGFNAILALAVIWAVNVFGFAVAYEPQTVCATMVLLFVVFGFGVKIKR